MRLPAIVWQKDADVAECQRCAKSFGLFVRKASVNPFRSLSSQMLTSTTSCASPAPLPPVCEDLLRVMQLGSLDPAARRDRPQPRHAPLGASWRGRHQAPRVCGVHGGPRARDLAG